MVSGDFQLLGFNGELHRKINILTIKCQLENQGGRRKEQAARRKEAVMRGEGPSGKGPFLVADGHGCRDLRFTIYARLLEYTRRAKHGSGNDVRE